ncbi:hypothetical protein D0817_21850 [Flavobacterium cupreum]|uniref:Uncharacterized protein n=3 Tax=Flavobacteriaceae TaxID=49546 RepID=A0A4Y7U561_9FLAO|nr:hypothetical protein D0817_21850 [Flavobacterium cupreum]TEB41364.1 hypothetical protein D0809_25900 [Flavobacterium circumlabens]
MFGCMAIFVIISSCSVDSMEDVKKINAENQNQFSRTAIDSLSTGTINTLDYGDNDKDKVKD